MKLTLNARKWINAILWILLVSLVLAGCNAESDPTETTATDPATEIPQPIETTEAATEPTETAPPTEESTEPTFPQPEPVSFEEALTSADLGKQRQWFYDFARQYRIDYLPEFSQEEGVPTDTHEILYWCATINDGTGCDGLILTADYVEETVLTHFGKAFGEHQSHFKSWEYDPETDAYTRWIESGRENQHYLLDALTDNGDGSYTVHAVLYTPAIGNYMEEQDMLRIRSILLDNTEIHTALEIPYHNSTFDLKPIADFYLTFRMNEETALPLFLQFDVTMIDENYSWW